MELPLPEATWPWRKVAWLHWVSGRSGGREKREEKRREEKRREEKRREEKRREEKEKRREEETGVVYQKTLSSFQAGNHTLELPFSSLTRDTQGRGQFPAAQEMSKSVET